MNQDQKMGDALAAWMNTPAYSDALAHPFTARTSFLDGYRAALADLESMTATDCMDLHLQYKIDKHRAQRLAQQAALEQATDLHAAIMNIPVGDAIEQFERMSTRMAYKYGHRDARHAAAELAISALSPQQAAPDQRAIPGVIAWPWSDPTELGAADLIDARRYRGMRDALVQRSEIYIETIGVMLPDHEHVTAEQWDAAIDAALVAMKAAQPAE